MSSPAESLGALAEPRQRGRSCWGSEPARPLSADRGLDLRSRRRVHRSPTCSSASPVTQPDPSPRDLIDLDRAWNQRSSKPRSTRPTSSTWSILVRLRQALIRCAANPAPARCGAFLTARTSASPIPSWRAVSSGWCVGPSSSAGDRADRGGLQRRLLLARARAGRWRPTACATTARRLSRRGIAAVISCTPPPDSRRCASPTPKSGMSRQRSRDLLVRVVDRLTGRRAAA